LLLSGKVLAAPLNSSLQVSTQPACALTGAEREELLTWAMSIVISSMASKISLNVRVVRRLRPLLIAERESCDFIVTPLAYAPLLVPEHSGPIVIT
jgi:hypothetical protein